MEPLIPVHGGYHRLRTFQCARLIYDATVVFCSRFVDRHSRTNDQMVQAARSGVQNIAEGSMASATSKKTEMKLTAVARASLEELLLDYEDFLRQHGKVPWAKESREALAVRRILAEWTGQPDSASTGNNSDKYLKSSESVTAANSLICLIHQTTFLLRRQLRAQERSFLSEGGFTERLYRERQAARNSLPPPRRTP